MEISLTHVSLLFVSVYLGLPAVVDPRRHPYISFFIFIGFFPIIKKNIGLVPALGVSDSSYEKSPNC